MNLLHQYGYSFVFCVVFLEQLGLPIPAAPFLLLAGAFVKDGEFSLPLILFVAIAAAFAGDAVWYVLGKKKGRSVLTLLCRISLSPDSCVRKTEESFTKRGVNSLLIAKFVPGLNTIAPPMAGMFHVTWTQFSIRDLAGCLLYAVALTLPGYFFEHTIFDVTAYLESIGHALLWFTVGVIGLYLLYKYIKLKILQRMLYKERITPKELHERMLAGDELTVVDLRAINQIEQSPPLPGAIRIPPSEIDLHLSKLDKARWIIMYCT